MKETKKYERTFVAQQQIERVMEKNGVFAHVSEWMLLDLNWVSVTPNQRPGNHC